MWDPSTIEVTASDLMSMPAASPGAATRGVLVLYSGDDAGRRFTLEPGAHVVGRSAAAGLMIDDASISRRHALLQVSQGGTVLHDLGSANGSWVNEQRVTAPRPLVDGDRLKLGRARLRFLVEANPDAQVHDRIWRLATTDAATGIWNRRHWMDALQQAVRLAARGGPLPAVVCIDLDHFKRVNDRWGHAAGDAVLREAVARWRAELGPGEALGRLGGEEFAVLLPAADATQARCRAERLREALAQWPMSVTAAPGAEPVRHVQTASLGVACWDAALVDADAMLQLADQRLYAAKHGGRNRVVDA
ncbi:GGDEF domain-containing protein [Ideonella sp. DXS22W]|uniref:diguanylate cyclase n=1 Tax=Pseudaquabacterium inlustre TaxID=2984192 RepID=A0ABU9CNN1_9BURK